MDSDDSTHSVSEKLVQMSHDEPDDVDDLEADDDYFNDDDDDDDNFGDFVVEEEDDGDDDNHYALLQAQFDKADLPSGVEVSLPLLINANPNPNPNPSFECGAGSSLAGVSTIEDILEIVQFPRFDVVDSFPDHHYAKHGNSETKPSDRGWAKRINKEWASLSVDLPETISVRVAEDRMDLLRAALVGPAGTPYHGGIFFFDCQFPAEYPQKPPLVYYHSGGLRINPNLYHCGKVCLSLLGTWSGRNSENWIPGKSTMLQVLVSIQAFILNEKPFFNEPGLQKMYPGAEGIRQSNAYNEKVFIFSLKTMVYSLRNPPEHFKELVTSHFRRRGRDILVACRAYSNETLCDSVIKNFKIIDQSTEKCSELFRLDVAGMTNTLVACFSKIGLPNCDKFRVDPDLLCAKKKEESFRTFQVIMG